MGFIESLLGSGLANAITLHAVSDSFKDARVTLPISIQSTGRPTNNATIDPSSVASLIADVLISKSSEARQLKYFADRTGIQKDLFYRAEKAIVSEKYDEALPLLIRAFRLDPLYIFYYSALGVCQHNQAKFDVALECYDVALDLADRARSSENHDYLEAVEGLSRKCEKHLKATTSEVNNVILRGRAVCQRCGELFISSDKGSVCASCKPKELRTQRKLLKAKKT